MSKHLLKTIKTHPSTQPFYTFISPLFAKITSHVIRRSFERSIISYRPYPTLNDNTNANSIEKSSVTKSKAATDEAKIFVHFNQHLPFLIPFHALQARVHLPFSTSTPLDKLTDEDDGNGEEVLNWFKPLTPSDSIDPATSGLSPRSTNRSTDDANNSSRSDCRRTCMMERSPYMTPFARLCNLIGINVLQVSGEEDEVGIDEVNNVVDEIDFTKVSSLTKTLSEIMQPTQQNESTEKASSLLMSLDGPAGPCYSIKPCYFEAALSTNKAVVCHFYVCRYGGEEFGNMYTPDGQLINDGWKPLVNTILTKLTGNDKYGRWDGRIRPKIMVYGFGVEVEEVCVYESPEYYVNDYIPVFEGGDQKNEELTAYNARLNRGFENMSDRILRDFWKAKYLAEREAGERWGGRDEGVFRAALDKCRELDRVGSEGVYRL